MQSLGCEMGVQGRGGGWRWAGQQAEQQPDAQATGSVAGGRAVYCHQAAGGRSPLHDLGREATCGAKWGQSGHVGQEGWSRHSQPSRVSSLGTRMPFAVSQLREKPELLLTLVTAMAQCWHGCPGPALALTDFWLAVRPVQKRKEKVWATLVFYF